MTILLWCAIGMTAGSAVLHAALGLRRPRQPPHLLFAGIMVFLTAYLYIGLRLYQAPSGDVAVELMRQQVFLILGCHSCVLMFVPAYTRALVSRPILAMYWFGLAVLFVINLFAPYGLWFSGEPEVIQSTFLGSQYTAIIAPSMSMPQTGYALYFISFLVLGLWCAVKAFRSGERQRSASFAIALVLLIGFNLVDIFRDMSGATWPYVAEPGFVTWALIMSIQLSHDFRVNAQALHGALQRVTTQTNELQSIVDAMRSLQDKMKVAVEVLDTGIAKPKASTVNEDEQLKRLRRAVAKLRDLERSMPVLE